MSKIDKQISLDKQAGYKLKVPCTSGGIGHLTLCQLVSSADDLRNSLDPDQARHSVGPDLDPNCLTL